MGLATIGPHSRKVQTKLYKIPKVGVNQASFDWDTAIWKCQIYKEMDAHPDAVWHSVWMAIHFFVNFDIFKWLYLRQN